MTRMEHSEGRRAVDARAAIAHLQQGVQVWIDSDRVLPSDGSSLLETLDRALAGLTGENAVEVTAGMGMFTRRVQALIEAGILEAGEGHRRVEAAAAIVACMRDARETGG